MKSYTLNKASFANNSKSMREWILLHSKEGDTKNVKIDYKAQG